MLSILIWFDFSLGSRQRIRLLEPPPAAIPNELYDCITCLILFIYFEDRVKLEIFTISIASTEVWDIALRPHQLGLDTIAKLEVVL